MYPEFEFNKVNNLLSIKKKPVMEIIKNLFRVKLLSKLRMRIIEFRIKVKIKRRKSQ